MTHPAFRIFTLALAAGLALALAAPAFAAHHEEQEAFTKLFNGKNLEGWVGDERLWKVEDGVLLGSSVGVKLEGNTFLSTKKSFGDFVLRVKVKLRNHNSGIQFRSEQRPDHVVAGYQADVAEKDYFGMIYREKAGGKMDYWNALSKEEQAKIHGAAKQGEWNAYVITCQGDHIKMVLNGKVVADIEHPEGEKKGIIALQLHAGPEMEVRFKDIEIKELKAGKE